MRLISIFLLTFIIGRNTFGQSSNSGIYINEFMASNTSVNIPGHNVFDDWIELYNSTSASIDLSGYYLTDDLTKPKKFRINATAGSLVIPAKGFLVIICSNNIKLGNNHVTFSLSASGESIGIFAPDGITQIDTYTFGYQRSDISMGRNPSNLSEWRYFTKSTIGGVNNMNASYTEILPPPTFSKNSGFYTDSFNLTLANNVEGVEIYYTLDGSVPNPADVSGSTMMYKNTYPEFPGNSFGDALFKTYKSYKYTESIPINNLSGTANNLTNISSTYHQRPYYIPITSVRKMNTIRAIAIKPGALSSQVVTKNYFIWPEGNPYSIPIASLSIPPRSLFDYGNGIYTAGVEFDNWRIENPNTQVSTQIKANFMQKGDPSEREANIEYFANGSSKFNQSIGVRINGSGSRLYPVKSLRLKARSNYGKSSMDFKVFDDLSYTSYKDLILRNSGQDHNKTMLRDGVIHDICKGLNFSIMNYRPSILFINGEYWGVHNVRERLSNNYYEQHFDIPEDSLDLVEVSGGVVQLQDGTLNSYENMMNYFRNNSLENNTNYTYITSILDMNSMIDYYASEIFMGNHDWLYNNVTMWRYKGISNTSKEKDGRWRYSLNDLDFGMGTYVSHKYNMFDFIRDREDPVFGKLEKNPTFRELFINRFADLLNTHFTPNRIATKINEAKAPLIPVIEEHTNRWREMLNYSSWNSEIDKMVQYAYDKVPEQRNQIRNKFNISSTHNLTVSVSDSKEGYIKINSIDILPSTPGIPVNTYPWTGVYFNNIPFKIYAKAKPNFKFKHWLVNNVVVSTDSVLQVNLTNDMNYKAVFMSTIYSENPNPIAKTISRCGFQINEWDRNATSPIANTAIVEMGAINPTINANISNVTSGSFNLTNGTRANGNGLDGISFINSEVGNIGFSANKIGGLVIALNTSNYDSLFVSWKGITITPHSKEYRIRLQYRLGDLQPFNDLLDDNGQVIEYKRSSTIGHSTNFMDTKLPSSICNKPHIQLFWRYYYTGVQNNLPDTMGDELGVDEIKVYSKKIISGTINTSTEVNQFSKIINAANYANGTKNTITSSKSIELISGFTASNGSVFKAEIDDCK